MNTMADETYADRIDEARKVSVTERVMRRELGERFEKVNCCMALGRPLGFETKNRDGVRFYNQNYRKCPSMYEADGADFTKHIYRSKETIKRCILCTRILHPLLDDKQICIFCKK